MAAQRIAPRMTPEDSVNETVIFSVGLASTFYLGSQRMATAEAHATFWNWAHAIRERPGSQARWGNGAQYATECDPGVECSAIVSSRYHGQGLRFVRRYLRRPYRHPMYVLGVV